MKTEWWCQSFGAMTALNYRRGESESIWWIDSEELKRQTPKEQLLLVEAFAKSAHIWPCANITMTLPETYLYTTTIRTGGIADEPRGKQLKYTPPRHVGPRGRYGRQK